MRVEKDFLTMEQNFFQTKEIIKIQLTYTKNKEKIKKEVKYRFMDNEVCMVASDSDMNFAKPKWKTKANLIVYTTEGIYNAPVTIKDIDWDMSETIYELESPKNWNKRQLRAGIRKEIELPIDIVFPDEKLLETYTSHMSISGFDILYDGELSHIAKTLPAKCKLIIPPETTQDADGVMIETSVKFVRQKIITEEYTNEGKYYYSFKFTKLSPEETQILSNIIMKFY